MKKLMVMAAVALGCAAGALADTAFAYQGNLRKDDGSPYSNETFTVTIGLYDKQESGTCLWIRETSARTSEDGTFNIEIGDGNSVPEGQSSSYLRDALAGSEPCYLELQVTEPGATTVRTVTPRQKVLAVPRALFAENVTEAQGDFSVKGCATFQNGIIITDGNGKSALSFSPSTDDDGNKLIVRSMDVSNSASADNMTIRQDLTVGGKVGVAGRLSVADITVSEGISVEQNATVGGNLAVKGKTLSAPNAAMTVNSLAVSSTNFTVNSATVVMPVGTIVMWYGTEETVPEGWAICNGKTTADGVRTPDLTGRFVIGAGGSAVEGSSRASDGGTAYTLVEKDGNLTASTGGVRRVALSLDEMPSHAHLYLTDTQVRGHFGAYNDGAEYKNNANGDFNFKSNGDNADIVAKTGTAGGGSTYSKDDVKEEGTVVAHENMPPYFALYYIMKVK